MPDTVPPVVFVFSAADGSLNQHNAEKLRQARTAGAQVVRFRFMKPPSEATS
jgi:hypothetical protein